MLNSKSGRPEWNSLKLQDFPQKRKILTKLTKWTKKVHNLQNNGDREECNRMAVSTGYAPMYLHRSLSIEKHLKLKFNEQRLLKVGNFYGIKMGKNKFSFKYVC